jgi:hypothetical protein
MGVSPDAQICGLLIAQEGLVGRLRKRAVSVYSLGSGLSEVKDAIIATTTDRHGLIVMTHGRRLWKRSTEALETTPASSG